MPLPRPAASSPVALDVAAVRADFPILGRSVRGKPLVYLDNAASTQKPRGVVEVVARFYRDEYANIHRGIHELSERATEAYEGARARTARFIGAADPAEVVFVRGATEAINLVARCWARPRLGAWEEILITQMEHHANIVPWQIVSAEVGARLRVAPISDAGVLDLAALERMITDRTRIVAVTHVSNVLGTVNPIQEICRVAHARGIPVLVDGAQAVPHRGVDVRALGCDFYAFSGHKVYGPTGIGVLWGRRDLLERLPPYQGGGEMIETVAFERSTFKPPPHRFEAGTPHIAGAIGLAAAFDWIEGLGLEGVAAHEERLLARAVEVLGEIPGLRIVGTPAARAGVVSFVLDGIHPHDVGTVLDSEGVAIRAGHHCAQPLMDRLGLPATARASFAAYNTLEEVEALGQAVRRAKEILG